MARPNYQFVKRQKDLAKKQKQEEKRLRKLEKAATPHEEDGDQAVGDAEPTAEE